MSTTTTDKLAFGVQEVAKAVGLSRSFIFAEIKDGRLKSFLVGNRRLIATSDLNDWLGRYRNTKSA